MAHEGEQGVNDDSMKAEHAMWAGTMMYRAHDEDPSGRVMEGIAEGSN